MPLPLILPRPEISLDNSKQLFIKITTLELLPVIILQFKLTQTLNVIIAKKAWSFFALKQDNSKNTF
jgi:hypothetical protein